MSRIWQWVGWEVKRMEVSSGIKNESQQLNRCVLHSQMGHTKIGLVGDTS